MDGQKLIQVNSPAQKPARKPTPAMLEQRQQVFWVSFAIWVCMAAWTLSIFFDHIDHLKSGYPVFQQVGASAGELIVLAFIYWHAFHPRIGVRKMSLLFSFLGGAVLMVHAGAVQGLKSAELKQSDAESRFAANAGQIVQSASQGAAQAANKNGGTKRQVQSATVQTTKAGQKEALDNLKTFTEKGLERVQQSTLLSPDYIRYWMYSGIFIITSLLLFGVLWKMLGSEKDDIDADFDGIPDSKQVPKI